MVSHITIYENDIAVFARGHAVICQNAQGVSSARGHLWEAPFDAVVIDVHFYEKKNKVVAVTENEVAVLAHKTGKVMWSTAIPGDPGTHSVLQDDTLVIAKEKTILAISLSKRARLFEAYMPGAIAPRSLPMNNIIGSGQVVVVGDQLGNVKAFDIYEGKNMWEAIQIVVSIVKGAGQQLGLSLCQDDVSVTSVEFGLVADWNTSSSAHHVQPGDRIIECNGTCITNMSELISCVKIGGALTIVFERSQAKMPAAITQLQMTTDAQLAIVGDYEGSIGAIDVKTGTKLWEAKLPKRIRVMDISADGKFVVVTDSARNIRAVKIETGSLSWEAKMPNYVNALQIFAEGTSVIVGDESGNINAILVNTGVKSWEQSAGTWANGFCITRTEAGLCLSNKSISGILKPDGKRMEADMVAIDGAVIDVGLRVTIKSNGKVGIVTNLAWSWGSIFSVEVKQDDDEVLECKPGDVVVNVGSGAGSIRAQLASGYLKLERKRSDEDVWSADSPSPLLSWEAKMPTGIRALQISVDSKLAIVADSKNIKAIGIDSASKTWEESIGTWTNEFRITRTEVGLCLSNHFMSGILKLDGVSMVADMNIFEGAELDVGVRMTIRSSGKAGIIEEVDRNVIRGTIESVKGTLDDGESFECCAPDAVAEVGVAAATIRVQLVGGRLQLQRKRLNDEGWSIEAPSSLVLWEENMPSFLSTLQLSTDGKFAIVGDNSGNIKALKTDRGSKSWESNVPVPIRALQLTGDGKLAIFGDESGSVNAIEVGTGNQLWEAKMPAFIRALELSADGKLLIVADNCGNINALKKDSGCKSWEAKMPEMVTALQLSADGKLAIIGDFSGNINALNMHAGSELWKSKVSSCITVVQLSADGNHVIVTDVGDNKKAFAIDTGAAIEGPPPAAPTNAVQGQISEMADFVTAVSKPSKPVADGGRVRTILDKMLRSNCEPNWAIFGGKNGRLTLKDMNTGVDLGVCDTLRPQELKDQMVFYTKTIASDGRIAVAIGSENRIVFWDLATLAEMGVSVQGTPAQFAKMSSLVDWCTLPMRLKYAIQVASFLVTTGQIASFAKALPTPQGPGSTIVETVLQAASHFQGLVGWVDTLSPWLFFAVFCGASSAASLYGFAVLVANEILEEVAWRAPLSRAAKVFKLLCHGVNVMATAGFIPIITCLLRALPCDGQGEMMVEDRSVECHSFKHTMYMILAVVLTMLVSSVTLRLSSVRFDLQMVEIQGFNPFNMYGDCVAQRSPQEHPLTLNDLMYERITIFVKLVMSVSQHMITNDIILSVILLVCSLALTTCGFVWDKYMSDQQKRGRFFEPNQASSAVDIGVSWHFATVMLATIYGPTTGSMWIVPLFTPAVALLGYFFRSVHTATSIRLRVTKA